MREKLVKLNKQRADLVASADAIMATANDGDRDLTDDEQAQFDDLMANIATTDKRIANEKAILDAKASQPTMPDAAAEVTKKAEAVAGIEAAPIQHRIQMPSRLSGLRCFTPENQGGTCDSRQKAAETAFRFGMWLKAIAKQPGAMRYCKDHGMALEYLSAEDDMAIGALYSEGSNTTGGYNVLPEFDAAMIRLVEAYGIARNVCRMVPMGSDTKLRNRRTGGLTAYFVGEGKQGTESTGSVDQVKLIAKKLMVLARITNELNADSIISEADNIAWEMAYAFAQKEDQCLFVGDGTSTYGGIVGLVQKLSTLNGVDEGGGLILAEGNLMSEVILGDFNRMVGILPEYAENDATWYSHKYFYATVMQRLEAAAGGNTMDNLVNGNKSKKFLGDPVKTTATMPKTDSNSQILALYGDIKRAVDFGDRAQITISVSDSATVGGESVFEYDELAFRATERIDMNVHDVGSSTEAGPVVGLISKSS